jgi:nicotinate phosphoribosyltransferase
MSLYRVGPLLTDLYELTMAAAYHRNGQLANATFSTFIRNSGPGRNYFVAAGLDDILNELENFHFSEGDIQYLERKGLFSDDFLRYLKTLRFSGTVRAMPEGTVLFSDEPILEITAPIIEAQIVETLILNTIGFQTIIATKAARCIHAADGRPLIDFSLRRTQGHYAGIKVARSTYIAGFAGTSNVLAGKIYDIPISGTMAHSFVMTFEDESEAFRAYADTFPDSTVLLIDTYDTISGAQSAVKIARELKIKGKQLIGVRLDSGDMVALSKAVRKILDDAGFPEVKIYASSGFDENKISEALSEGAAIDAFGVGTKMGVSADAPYFDIVYKLVRFNDRDVRKLSPGKITLAGEKQVFRKKAPDGRYTEDIIGLRDEAFDEGAPLMETVMENGRRLQSSRTLEQLRDRFKKNFSLLDNRYKTLDKTLSYPVIISPGLEALQGNLSQQDPR